MAVDTDTYPEQPEIPTQQQLASEIEESPPITQIEATPSKFYSHFIFKSVIVVVVLVALPLFPSQPPDFVNQTIPNRSWELFHLLFVGIAVSYGLFSRRNVEPEKENQFKYDNAQTYVSRILQVSSVFDEQIIDSTSSGSDEHQIQTWSSMYYRDESRVVVAEHNSVIDEQTNQISSGHVDIKPLLLLPIRSLRSQVSESNVGESVNGTFESSGSVSWSGLGSFDTTHVNGEIRDMGSVDFEEKLKENDVLPSPIPWRSRSGRMVVKEEVDAVTTAATTTTSTTATQYSPSVKEPENTELDSQVSFLALTHWSSEHNVVPHLPENRSTSPVISPGLQLENMEDNVNTNFSNISSSPAELKSPPMGSYYSTFAVSNSSSARDGILEEKKEMRRRSKEQKELRRRSREELSGRREMELYMSKSESQSRAHIEGSSKGKSVRTVRPSERVAEARKELDVGGDHFEEKTEKRSKEVEAVLPEKRGKRTGGLDRSEEKTEKRSKDVEAVFREKRGKRTGGLDRSEEKTEKRSKEKRGKRTGSLDQLEEKTEKRSKEVQALLMEKAGKRTGGSDQLSISNGTPSYEDQNLTTQPPVSKHQKKNKKRLVEKVILEYEEYSCSEVDEVKGLSDNKEAASDTVSSISSTGSDSNEVDKKADEFIAKFREQIRLQRIQSMKSSNEQRSSRNFSRCRLTGGKDEPETRSDRLVGLLFFCELLLVSC